MKTITNLLFSTIAALLLSLSAQAQCGAIELNLAKGTLNGLSPNDAPEHIKKLLPCFTGETEEGSSYNEGGGVFFRDHDFYFYTHRDYIELRTGFKYELPYALAFETTGYREVEKSMKVPEGFDRLFRGFDPLPENVLVSIDENDLVYKTQYGYISFAFINAGDGKNILDRILIFTPKKLFE